MNAHILLASKVISRTYHPISPRKHETACDMIVSPWMSYQLYHRSENVCIKYSNVRQVQGRSPQNLFVLISSECGSHTEGSRRMYSVIVTHIRCGETTGTGRPSGSKTNRAPPSAARAIALCREAHYLYQSTYNLQLYLIWKFLTSQTAQSSRYFNELINECHINCLSSWTLSMVHPNASQWQMNSFG